MYSIEVLNDSMIYRLSQVLAYWLKGQFTDWLLILTNTCIGLLIQGSTDWLIDWQTQILAYWLKGQLTDWLNDSHKYWPTDSRVNWLTDWFTNTITGILLQRFTDWLILMTIANTDLLKQGLTDWLIDWLTQLLAYWLKG